MTTIPIYTGYQVHKLDSKYRVAIPAAWRNGVVESDGDECAEDALPEGVEESFTLLEATRFELTYIRVLTQESLTEHIERIRHRPDTPIHLIDEALEYFFSMIYRIKLSPQGKILIPEKWSHRAGLVADGKVTLVGRGNCFEIWNSDSYQIVKQRERERLKEMMPDIRMF